MRWTVEWDERALKELKRLSPDIRKRIYDYMQERVDGSENPRLSGKPLTANKRGLWRYRMGDYRILCHIENKTCIVLVISAGHRKHVYD